MLQATNRDLAKQLAARSSELIEFKQVKERADAVKAQELQELQELRQTIMTQAAELSRITATRDELEQKVAEAELRLQRYLEEQEQGEDEDNKVDSALPVAGESELQRLKDTVSSLETRLATLESDLEGADATSRERLDRARKAERERDELIRRGRELLQESNDNARELERIRKLWMTNAVDSVPPTTSTVMERVVDDEQGARHDGLAPFSTSSPPTQEEYDLLKSRYLNVQEAARNALKEHQLILKKKELYKQEAHRLAEDKKRYRARLDTLLKERDALVSHNTRVGGKGEGALDTTIGN